MRRLLLAAALWTLAAGQLPAQRLGPPEPRPVLRDVPDSNDAQAYYEAGLALFDHDAATAAAAFYWAARLNPAWGEPLYARRAALLMNNRLLLRKMFTLDRRALAGAADFHRLDSLQFGALVLNPFLYRRLDYAMFTRYVRDEAVERNRVAGVEDPSTALLNSFIESYLKSAGPRMRAWVAYAHEDFPLAQRNYERAYEIARDRAGVRLERGRIYGMLHKPDSAMRELQLTVDELRADPDSALADFYDSKAMAFYSIAMLREGTGEIDGARAAYASAIGEDSTWYPAHMRLGLLALGRRDTSAAIRELGRASRLAPGDPLVHYTNGWILGVTKRYPDAIAELQRAVELEPYYALSYLRLGQLHELAGARAEAAKAYRAFLDRASRTDLNRPYATERLAEVMDAMAARP